MNVLIGTNTSYFQIPIIDPPLSFGVNLAGINYTMALKWNDSDQAGWVMDIADENNTPLACGIPLVTGADLLSGLDYLGIQGALVLYTNGDESAVPTYENLGTGCLLYFVTNAASS